MTDSNIREALTVREAMTAVALEEIDAVIKRLETVSAQTKALSETLPAYFEDASNQVADIIKHGVETDIKIAHDRLQKMNEEVSNTVELQRKLNKRLESLSHKILEDNSNKQAIIMAVASAIGSFIAVFLAMIIFKFK